SGNHRWRQHSFIVFCAGLSCRITTLQILLCHVYNPPCGEGWGGGAARRVVEEGTSMPLDPACKYRGTSGFSVRDATLACSGKPPDVSTSRIRAADPVKPAQSAANYCALPAASSSALIDSQLSSSRAISVSNR